MILSERGQLDRKIDNNGYLHIPANSEEVKHVIKNLNDLFDIPYLNLLRIRGKDIIEDFKEKLKEMK